MSRILRQSRRKEKNKQRPRHLCNSGGGVVRPGDDLERPW
nr:MAG TPA: hypothetical protein [Caudoviricetes sp.]